MIMPTSLTIYLSQLSDDEAQEFLNFFDGARPDSDYIEDIFNIILKTHKSIDKEKYDMTIYNVRCGCGNYVLRSRLEDIKKNLEEIIKQNKS